MEITLLSYEEAKKLPEEILQCKTPEGYVGFNASNGNCYWWLRSPGYYCYDAANVSFGGWGYDDSNDVCSNLAVRPALQNFTSDEIAEMPKTKKGYVKYLGTKWIDISEYLGYPCLLKETCLKEAHRFDAEINDYEKSEIKKFIEDWFEKRLNHMPSVKDWHDSEAQEK